MENEMENKLPDDKWYIFYDAENAKNKMYKIMNNSMINRDPFRKDWYYKRNIRSIEGRKNGKYLEKFFFGPFESIFECKLYLRLEKLEWMKKDYKRSKLNYEKNTTGYRSWYDKATYESLDGEIKKLEKWMNESSIERPEYFI